MIYFAGGVKLPLKALIKYIWVAYKRREEQKLRDIYVTTLLQYIMEHKAPKEFLPLYLEALKSIYPDDKPKERKKTAAEIIAETRRNIARKK